MVQEQIAEIERERDRRGHPASDRAQASSPVATEKHRTGDLSLTFA